MSKISLRQVKETVVISWRLLKTVFLIDPVLFCISLFAILIPGVIPFVNIYIYKLLIDMVVAVSGGAEFNPEYFYLLIGLRVITYFMQDASFRVQNFVERLLWTKIPIELNQTIFKKISVLDIHYFEDDKFRDILAKLRESYEHRPQRLVTNLFYTFQSLILMTIAFTALANLNWWFAVLILLITVPEFIYQTYESKLAWGIWNDESKLKKRYHHLTHLLQHHKEVKEIKIFTLAGTFISELKKLQQTFYNNNKRLAKRSLLTGFLFNGISSGVLIGIEVYVVFQALAKKLTVGDIAFYTSMVGNFQNGVGGLLRNIHEVYDSSLYIKTMYEVLDSKPIVNWVENGKKIKSGRSPEIEFNNVSFAYPGSSTLILNRFNLIIRSGEKIAFVGENGAGKSTIIKLLARFYDVNEGEILVNGVNIKELDRQSWYNTIGVLFQDFNRYEDAARMNIEYGDVSVKSPVDSVVKASKLAGAHEMIDKYPQKYDQMLGKMFEGGIELSGGQWQKIALARAFFRNAPILVLDEPTAAIDAKAESEIFERVERLSEDKTVIIISHRFSTVRNADKIYVIDEGKIKESGTHHDLMKLAGQYAELFNLQAKGYR